MVGKLEALFIEFVNYFFNIAVLILPVLLIVLAWRFGYTLAVYYGDRIAESINRRRRFKKLGDNSSYQEVLHKIRTLHPKEFEYYIADILVKNGYKAKVVGGFGKPDNGIDIVARKDGVHTLVQCKKFIDRDVGVKHIRELYGVGADLRQSRGAGLMFVSTTYFTQAAKDFAKRKDIKLIDADSLLELVFSQEMKGNEIGFNGLHRSEVMRHVPPVCPVCSKPLAWRQGPHGDFMGCNSYPQCKYVFSSSDANNTIQ